LFDETYVLGLLFSASRMIQLSVDRVVSQLLFDSIFRMLAKSDVCEIVCVPDALQ